MNKRNIMPLFALATMTLCLVGCDGAKAKEFTLALNSKAFTTSFKTDSAPALDTYHASNEGDVPYVKLSQYCDAIGDPMTYNPYSVAKENGTYVVYFAEGEEAGAKKHALYRFDPAKNNVTFLEGCNYQFRIFTSMDPYAEGASSYQVPNTEKTKKERIWDSRTIDFGKYDLAIAEQSGELLAPLGLFQAVFSERAKADGANPLIFNGRDYHAIVTSSGQKASCLSSSLHFSYADQGLLNLSVQVTDALIEPNLAFSPVKTEQGEKYRFETEKVVTVEFTPPGQQEKTKLIPNFKIRLVLDESGKGKYTYINADTNQVFEIASIGLKTREVQYIEEPDVLLIALMPAQEGAQGEMIRVNKKETFYLQEKRSKEYATYDYNLIRLHFGEFYGLHNRTLSFDTLIAPYKDLLCSTSYDDYNEGMSRFLYTTVDDGHTSVTGYSLFGKKKLDQAEAEKLRSYRGYRLQGLANYLGSMKAYREASNVLPGYEVVGDTAYLAFDSFSAASNSVTEYNSGKPSDYVTNNTIGFAYTSLKDIAANHKEVKRVVYDLSCNGGGAISTLPFLMATMTDDPTLPIINYYSGEIVTAHYKVDLNGDGIFGGEGDTYKGKYEFYILTSPMSFSCGNALPGYAKASKCATIIGARSGGGGAIVDQAVTVSGFNFNSSSMLAFTTKDESGKDIENDDGIPVDIEIPVSSYYNRSAINTILDKQKK